MTIVFGEHTIGAWFVSMDGNRDWLCAAHRDEQGAHLVGRVRIYVDDKRFDSDDVKKWVEVHMDDATDDEVIEKARRSVMVMASQAQIGSEHWELLMRDCDDVFEFGKAWHEMPFNEAQVVQ